jgi:hypothetical protein
MLRRDIGSLSAWLCTSGAYSDQSSHVRAEHVGKHYATSGEPSVMKSTSTRFQAIAPNELIRSIHCESSDSYDQQVRSSQ